MLRVLLLVALAALVAAQPVRAQDAPRRVRSVQAVRPAPADALRPLRDVITLRNFDPQEEQWMFLVEAAPPADSGFAYGTNYFGDRAKAAAFALPDGLTEAQVTEINVWFGYRRDGLTNQTYRLEIIEGTSDFGPIGDTRLSESFLLADVNADADFDTDEGPTTHSLIQPVTVGASFFVSVDFGSYGAADWGNTSLTSTALLGRPIAEVWEQWTDGVWYNMSNVWNFGRGTGTDGAHLWVEVIAETGTGTAVEDGADELPGEVALGANYPNPFNPSTVLHVELPARMEVDLRVVDLLGRTVAVLVQGPMDAGVHAVRFEAEGLPSGLYLARLHAGAVARTRVMALLR